MQKELFPSVGAPGYGYKTDLNGNTLAVSAIRFFPEVPGTVFIYRKINGIWIETDAKSGKFPDSLFGMDVKLSSSEMFVSTQGGFAGPTCDIGEVTLEGVPDTDGVFFYSSSDCPFEDCDVTILLGDVNCDGDVNLLDVAPFVDVLTSAGFSDKADINQDGSVDLLDVAPFVSLLAG